MTFRLVGNAGSSITMVVCFTLFRRILLHRLVTRLEQGLVVILSTSKKLCLVLMTR